MKKSAIGYFNKQIVCVTLFFILSIFSIAFCGFSSMKQQSHLDNIVDSSGELLFGRIQSLQVDSSGNLYIAINNHNILKIMEDDRTLFYFGYEARSAYQFAVIQNILNIQYANSLYLYDLQGNFIARHASPAESDVIENYRSVTFENREYRIEQHGMFDEVWRYDENGARKIYSRLAWSFSQQICLSAIVALVTIVIFVRLRKSNQCV